MSNLDREALFILVKSLTKAEKRHFKLTHDKVREVPLFVRLFNEIDKMTDYDEGKLITRIKGLEKAQLSSLKRHLYGRVLDSIRQLSVRKDIRIEIRQQIDFSQVLYNKGLYQQSLNLLNKAKRKANRYHEIELVTQILEFEKIIEARHITRSMENRAESLRKESVQTILQLKRLSQLSNLALMMYGQYIKKGHIRTRAEGIEMKAFFNEQAGAYNLIYSTRASREMPNLTSLSFYEKVNLYQAHSWYAYIVQDFLLYYRYSQKWVDLFEKYPEQKKVDSALYLKALNNLLTAHFFNLNPNSFDSTLIELEAFWRENNKTFNQNTKTLAFVYGFSARLNKHFLEGTFAEGLYLVEEFERQLANYSEQIDSYRILVFHYKIACLYFGSGDNNSSIAYLNKIINLKVGNLKPDIQCFARILHLIAHYELKNFDLLEYLLPSLQNFLEKNKEMSGILAAVLSFLKRFNRFGFRGLKPGFIALKEQLQEIASDPYERRFFLYLDVISWLESKIENRSVQEVIHEKFLFKTPRI